MEQPNPNSAEGRYATLKAERDPYMRRAEDAARLTIPTLFPPEGHTSSTPLDKPYQSIGARGVNNLAAKSLLALFPPGSSFFRLTPEDVIEDEIDATMGEDAGAAKETRTLLEAAYSKAERKVLARMEAKGARAPLHDTLRHILVAGNVLLQVLPDGRLRNHYLNSYVCKRDPEGQAVEIVVLEKFALATLPEAAKEIVRLHPQEGVEHSPENHIAVYTQILLADGKWKAHQEVNQHTIPGTEGEYSLDKSPWIPLRFSRIEGESYGRGMVEEYYGDLASHEALSKALVEFAGIAANVKFLVEPGSVTKIAELARSRNGAFVKGSVKDVNVLALDKFADFRVAKEMSDTLEQRLGEAFLVGSSAVRDAERVTAEEIRLIASELEQALGGFYSILAVELQLPLVSRYIYLMIQDKSLPKLPDTRPTIVTGMDALGRGGDLAKLDSLIAGVKEIFGPQEVAKYVNTGAYLVRRATALGLDIKGLVRSDDEVAGINQQAAAQEALKAVGPQMVKNAGETQSANPGADPSQEL